MFNWNYDNYINTLENNWMKKKNNKRLKKYTQFTMNWKALKWHHHGIDKAFSCLVDCSVLVP